MYKRTISEPCLTDETVSNESIGLLLQSIKDGTAESQYFHLFGDPALKLPMPVNSLDSISLDPDTLKTLI